MNSILRLIKTAVIPLFTVLTLWLSVPASAATFYVYMDENGFDPSYQEIQVGDAVLWINSDSWGDPHTTTSSDGYWDSGPVPFGYYVSVTFPFAGTFPYYDQFTGATGTIVVSAPSPPPPPLLTDPARLPDGSFQCTVTNLVVDKTFVIQASTNLLDWSGIYTNVASTTSYTYQDHDATALPQRFYRALALP